MTETERVHHNARLILPQVRNLSKPERIRFYDTLRLGPIFWPIAAIAQFSRNAHDQHQH